MIGLRVGSRGGMHEWMGSDGDGGGDGSKGVVFKQQRPLALFRNILYLPSFTENMDTISSDYKGMFHLGTYCSENRERNACAQAGLVRMYQGNSNETDDFIVQKHLSTVNYKVLSSALWIWNVSNKMFTAMTISPYLRLQTQTQSRNSLDLLHYLVSYVF